MNFQDIRDFKGEFLDDIHELASGPVRILRPFG
jgi:hypothetical protein